MTLPDNRLRLPVVAIDFDNEVGITGQDHDSWPAPGEQARYDWMRLWLISLLANQSSYDEPSQYRDGTIWFDLNTSELKVRKPIDTNTSGWVSLAETISVGDQYLSDFVTEIQDYISALAPEITWSGHCVTNDSTVIPVPSVVSSYIDVSKTRPMLYVNGILSDPRTVSWHTGPSVRIVGWSLSSGDTFTVIVANISGSRFHLPEVVV